MPLYVFGLQEYIDHAKIALDLSANCGLCREGFQLPRTCLGLLRSRIHEMSRLEQVKEYSLVIRGNKTFLVPYWNPETEGRQGVGEMKQAG